MSATLLAAWLQVAYYPTSGTPVMASERIITYDVAGTTATELWQDIARHGPTDPASGDHYTGDLRWDLHWNGNLSESPNGCSITSIDVTIDTTMTIPRWTNPRQGSESLQVAWDVFLSRLKLHESGHRANAIKAAQAVREAIAGVGGQTGTCISLRASTDTAAHHWKKVDQDYDVTTRHGITHGRSWRSLDAQGSGP